LVEGKKPLNANEVNRILRKLERNFRTQDRELKDKNFKFNTFSIESDHEKKIIFTYVHALFRMKGAVPSDCFFYTP